MNSERAHIHNKYAPWWAAGLILFGVTGVSTTWIDWGGFWNGYVLDITGPAWNYILFRGLSRKYSEHKWYRIFTPINTFIIFVIVAYAIEFAQYLEFYDATFDIWDLVSYVSLMSILFILDLFQQKRIRSIQ